MKKFTIQVILLIIVISVLFYFFLPGSSSPFLPFIPNTLGQKTLQINGNSILVEIADSSKERSKGLGGRESLASGSGMLFVFEKPDKYAFWVKDVKFPLDFIYIRDNKVVDVIRNIPPPQQGETEENLPQYLPKVEVDMVLEVPAGTVNDLNIFEGDTVKLAT